LTTPLREEQRAGRRLRGLQLAQVGDDSFMQPLRLDGLERLDACGERRELRLQDVTRSTGGVGFHDTLGWSELLDALTRVMSPEAVVGAWLALFLAAVVKLWWTGRPWAAGAAAVGGVVYLVIILRHMGARRA
jgi:hypothetical protein